MDQSFSELLNCLDRLSDEREDLRKRLRTAYASASYDPDNQGWAKFQDQVANALLGAPAVQLALWMDLLRPVREKLLATLSEMYHSASRPDVERSRATDILAEYAADQPQVLAGLLMDADEKQFAVIYRTISGHGEMCLPMLSSEIDRKVAPGAKDDDKERLAKRQANAAVALLRMNQPSKVWPLLEHSPDSRVRSYLIHRLSPLGVDARVIVERLGAEPDVTICRALLLGLGEYGEKELSPENRKALLPRLQKIYRTEPDPGLHAASECLLRQWKEEAWLKQVNEEWAKDKEQRYKRLEEIKQTLAKDKRRSPPQWFVNGQGQTMVVVPGPVELMMGSPLTEVDRENDERQHKRRIGRTFALAAKSVTLEQYRQFAKGYELPEKCAPTGELPVVGTSWYQAAAYCNWLSNEEGIPECQWCYEIVGQETKLRENYLSLSGYRLPSEAEMEYVTRAGALTSRHYGETDELLQKYAWFQKNSNDQTWPVGSLKPNDLGLFDVLGNVWTWCQESYKSYPEAKNAESSNDQECGLMVLSTDSRVLRGGSFVNPASVVRSAQRSGSVPASRIYVGFRPARTFR